MTPLESTRKSYYNMLDRCLNKDHAQYANYGGRGIGVCDEWLHWPTFLSDMGVRPDGLTLERKENDKGYSKTNCVWATNTEQALNRRIRRPINSSKITGVYWREECQLWRVNYKGIWLGAFDNLLDAAATRKSVELK